MRSLFQTTQIARLTAGVRAVLRPSAERLGRRLLGSIADSYRKRAP